MSTSAVVVSTAAAGLLALGLPALLRRLPDPVTDEPQVSYAELAAWRWALPLGVVVAAAAAGAMAWRLDEMSPLVGLVPLVPVLVLAAYVDARVHLLPKQPILVATGLGLVLLVLEAAITGEAWPLGRAVLGAVIARSIFWVLWRVNPAAMGFGDVRLAALVGLALARLGWAQWELGLYSGLICFAVWAVGRAVRRRSRAAMREPLPYGPFMILGMLVGVLAG